MTGTFILSALRLGRASGSAPRALAVAPTLPDTGAACGYAGVVAEPTPLAGAVEEIRQHGCTLAAIPRLHYNVAAQHAAVVQGVLVAFVGATSEAWEPGFASLTAFAADGLSYTPMAVASAAVVTTRLPTNHGHSAVAIGVAGTW